MPAALLPNDHPLFDVIQTRLALKLDDHRRADIARALDEMVLSGDLTDLQSFTVALAEQSITQPLWQKLIRAATIGETYFFRDQGQINALRSSVLPDLIVQKRREGRLQLRVWSAGCSTGEEPYTLAILLRQLIPDFVAWHISILATDLCVRNLERAQTGQYGSWSFRSEMPDEVRERWFVGEQGSYRIDRSIRDMVTFAPLNLASTDYPSLPTKTTEMDLILCRNVLIYFDNPNAAEVIKRFHGALEPNGWLVIGHAESIHMAGQDFALRTFESAVLYQKRGEPLPETSNWLDVLDTSPFSFQFPSAAPPLPKTAPLATRVTSRLSPQMLTASARPDPLEHARQAADKECWPDALRWLTEAEKGHKMRPEVHYLRGIIELAQEQIDSAVTSLRRAIYCDNTFVLAHFVLGEIYEKQGHPKKASSQWRHAQSVLGTLPPEQPIRFSDDLTVEMMGHLLSYRLDRISVKSQGDGNAAS